MRRLRSHVAPRSACRSTMNSDPNTVTSTNQLDIGTSTATAPPAARSTKPGRHRHDVDDRDVLQPGAVEHDEHDVGADDGDGLPPPRGGGRTERERRAARCRRSWPCRPARCRRRSGGSASSGAGGRRRRRARRSRSTYRWQPGRRRRTQRAWRQIRGVVEHAGGARARRRRACSSSTASAWPCARAREQRRVDDLRHRVDLTAVAPTPACRRRRAARVTRRVAVRPQLHGVAAAVVGVEPGLQAAGLLRAAAVATDQRAGAPTVGVDLQVGRQHVVDVEARGRAVAGTPRTRPTRSRRGGPARGASVCERRVSARSQSCGDRARRTPHRLPSTSTTASPVNAAPCALAFSSSRSRRASAVRPGGSSRGAATAIVRACRRCRGGRAPRSHGSSPCRRRRRRASDGEHSRTQSMLAGRRSRSTIDARTAQKPGQLLLTTSGSSTSMPSTTVASTPNAIARRWSSWLSSSAPCSVAPARCAGRRRRRPRRAPALASSLARSPSRSLSLRRMKPTPWMVVGVDAVAATTASVGTRSEMSGHVDLDATQRHPSRA